MTQEAVYHRICSLDINGGFLDGVHIDFENHLNCLIGGRGTGKTSILELMRWALGQMPDPVEDKPLHKKISDLVKANLEDGRIRIAIRTSAGISYTVQRTIDSEPIVLSDAGEAVDIQIGRGTIFSAEVYSQSQIEEIADDPRFQLKLIDKFIAGPIGEVEDKIVADLRDLGLGASEILRLTEEITSLGEKVAELPEVIEKLKAYQAEEGDEAAKALQRGGEAKTLREQEKKVAGRLQELFSESEGQLRNASSQLVQAIERQFPEGVLGGPNEESMKEMKRMAMAGAQEFKRLADEAAQSSEETRRALGVKSQHVHALHLTQEVAYQELLQEHEMEKGRAKERDRLLKRQAELQEDANRLESLQDRLALLSQEREARLRRLSERKDERFAQRDSVGAMLTEKLSPSIRVQIEQEGNIEQYLDCLMAALKNCGFQYSKIVSRAVQQVPPARLAELIQRGDEEARTDLAELLDVDPDKAERIVKHLRNTKEIFDIETVELYDRPTIELQDGSRYKDSNSLSTGQKCTTILPILLLESASPLLIDQPEDNLDNAYIYETVVKSIKAVRGRRQLILVTHNPNIPVLGDAQQVVVLKSTGQRAKVKIQGSVDEVKADIETVLEGGREAFHARKERYGY